MAAALPGPDGCRRRLLAGRWCRQLGCRRRGAHCGASACSSASA